MSAPGWRILLVVEGFGPRGRSVPVVTGLIETGAGGVQLALRVGDNGETELLPLQAARQLVVNLCEAMTDRLKVSAEVVGDDEP